MRVELIFFLIGAIILVGFIARILFERTRIPDVLSDTFAIVALLTLMGLAEAPHSWMASGLSQLARSFGIAAVVALATSVIWLLVLEYTKRRPLSYLLTFAVIILTNLIMAGGLLMCRNTGTSHGGATP